MISINKELFKMKIISLVNKTELFDRNKMNKLNYLKSIIL